MSQNVQRKNKLSYHLRKMLAIEKKVSPPSQAILDTEWLSHQKEAEDMVWYLGPQITDHQKQLVFRWI